MRRSTSKMNAMLIIALVVVAVVIGLVIYFSSSSSTSASVYTTSVNGNVLYTGSARPVISSDDYDIVAVGYRDKVDFFTIDGTKLGIANIPSVKGVAYNKEEETFLVVDNNSALYAINLQSFDHTQIAMGYTALYDTASGFFAKHNGISIVSGELSDKTPINGSYGNFDVVTKVK